MTLPELKRSALSSSSMTSGKHLQPQRRRRSSVRSVSSLVSSSSAPSGRLSLSKVLRSPSSYIQKQTARKSAKVVNQYVEQLTSKAPFLQSHIAEKKISIPLFHRDEVIVGDVLGEGGFSRVYSVTGFALREDFNSEVDEAMVMGRCDIMKKHNEHCTSPDSHRTPTRYALKQVQKKMLKQRSEFSLAAADLCVETMYLAALSHSHILPVRGMTAGGTNYKSYFLIMDRLDDTLDKHIHIHWARQPIRNQNARVVHQQLTFAHQIASAMQYLHSRRIIFRDCKPKNIGLQLDGSTGQLLAKLFDFGLCREMPKPRPKKRRLRQAEAEDYFLMTGVGTRRYMAPEICIHQRYNLKADCYSFAITTYELLSLQRPFENFQVADHQELVCFQGRRPNLNPLYCNPYVPRSMISLLRKTWAQNPNKRLAMDAVVELMDNVLKEFQNEHGIASVLIMDGGIDAEKGYSLEEEESVVSATETETSKSIGFTPQSSLDEAIDDVIEECLEGNEVAIVTSHD